MGAGGERAGAGAIVLARGNLGMAVAAASAFVGKPVDSGAADASRCRAGSRGGAAPLEIWDGAHNPEGVRFLLELLPERDYVLVCSVVGDKDVDTMLAASRPRSASISSPPRPRNPRALPAEELAARAEPLLLGGGSRRRSGCRASRARAELRGPDGAVLVDRLALPPGLARRRPIGYVPWDTLATG